MKRVALTSIHYRVCGTADSGKLLCAQEAQLMLRDDLEGYDGREAQEEGIYVCT